jgi:hypothetical protein
LASLRALFPLSPGKSPPLQTSEQTQSIPLSTSDQIKKARLKASQARARLQALKARLNEDSRKLDTRCKIILGGLLIDAAGKNERYAKMVTALILPR